MGKKDVHISPVLYLEEGLQRAAIMAINGHYVATLFVLDIAGLG